MNVSATHVLSLVGNFVLNVVFKPVFAQIKFSCNCIQVSDCLCSEGSIALNVLSDRNFVLFFAGFEVAQFA